MGAELDAVFIELAQIAKAPDLESARVGEDGALPAHEPMQTAHLADGIDTGAEIQVISVAEQDLDPELVEHRLGNALHGALRPDGHEYWSLNGRVRKVQVAAARGTFTGNDFEAQGDRKSTRLNS